ncbi:polyhydroxyalkanoic acid system family protein [Photobacterium sp. DA100]|uniref:polyhydroxyalkanoic acid system family protein n=1 Tax=Photobacterium sp. DA100 TaxID=3027472 RepID=UPI002478A861|nr:polyhydroxyalkanoic acid system family protein [Photobacterium sp. DA100]WEM40857.1 polyhydroxyalkanoic acid system family protein [Photobacterium sp. DA100]
MTILIERHHDRAHDDITMLSEKIAGQLEQEYGLTWSWQDDKMHIKHSAAKGFLHAEEGKITIQLQLMGFAAAFFATTIESHITEQLDKHLLAS